VNGFETLKTIDVGEMYRRTHISVAELQAILAKRFDAFNRAKALGFFKILEREYALDLSELIAEYEAFCGGKNENDRIFVVAKEEKSSAGKYLAIVLVLIAVVLGWAFAQFLKSAPSGSSSASSPTVAVAANAATTNTQSTPSASTAPNAARTASVPSAPSSPIEEAKAIVSAPPPSERLAPIAVEPAAQAGRNDAAIAPTSQFYVVPKRDLWVGILYLDSGQREQRTISARYDFDPIREVEITFGHGEFKLVYGSEIIEPETNLTQRMRFNAGSVARLSTFSQRRAQETATSNTGTN
jgi:hypothetical protein